MLPLHVAIEAGNLLACVELLGQQAEQQLKIRVQVSYE